MRLNPRIGRQPNPLKNHIWLLSPSIRPHDMRMPECFWCEFFLNVGQLFQISEKHLHKPVSIWENLIINRILLDVSLIYLSKLWWQRDLPILFGLLPAMLYPNLRPVGI